MGSNLRVATTERWPDPAPTRHDVLVERESELDKLARVLDDARQGNGQLAFIEGAAGTGKTTLLAAATRYARKSPMIAAYMNGRELEGEFVFGATIQAFESCWARADADRRAQLTAGPAHLAAALFEGRLGESGLGIGDPIYPVIHGLFRFIRNLVASEAGPQPLAIIVDDAHWLDGPSLHLLAYLAARLAELPLAMLVTLRPVGGANGRETLSALRRVGPAAVIQTRNLSAQGMEQVIRSQTPSADRTFVSACYTLTRGNPFQLAELLYETQANARQLDAATATRLTDNPPAAIVAAADDLLAASPSQRALASAVAVLGEGVPFTRAARVAELDVDTAALAADALAANEVLEPGTPLSFVHPLLRSAVLQLVPPVTRGQLHSRAAMILREEGAPPEAVATQVLVAPTDCDPASIDLLRAAARDKLAAGDAPCGARMLARALDEQPAPQLYPDLVAELALAEAEAGMPQATDRLGEAIGVVEQPDRRAELALTRGRLLVSDDDPYRAAELFESALQWVDGSDQKLSRELEAAYVSAACFVPDLAADGLARRARLMEALNDSPDEYQRRVVAATLIIDSFRGEKRSRIRQLAELAWGAGSLPTPGPARSQALGSLTAALLYVDELEFVLEICESIAAGDRQSVGPAPGATISSLRAWSRYERGEIDGAASDAQAALDGPDPASTAGRPLYELLARCRLLRGDFDQAERALRIIGDHQVNHPLSQSCLLGARAQLRLVQHRPAEAQADALRAGEILESDLGVTNPGVVPWRSTAAMAYAALDQPERAQELAAEELDLAQQIGITRVQIRALRVLGTTIGGETGIDLLKEAVAAGERSPPRLESTIALLELGAALRRRNKRAAARTPLRKALEQSAQSGASLIAGRVREELAAAGGRPRRTALSGVESLTPSERRVAELAAQELTTRMIAETLVITPKTVEFHLRNIYRKLDVSSRAQLVETFAGDAAA